MMVSRVLLGVFLLPGALVKCSQKSNLFITTPRTMEALEGSCLQIPCNFSANTDYKFEKVNITAMWIKHDHKLVNDQNYVVFTSSRRTAYPINITGNLQEKNCSTLFSNVLMNYSNSYFFRVETDGFKATACDGLLINVTDSPPRPRIEMSGDQREKQPVTITCSAWTPCPGSPPTLSWNLQQGSQHRTEQNTDRTFTTKIQEVVTLSDVYDGYQVNCSAMYPLNEGEDARGSEATLTLSVSYAPKNTAAHISPSGCVSSGSWVNLTCSSRAKPPISRFAWFKNSSKGRPIELFEGAFYSFQVTNSTDRGGFYCVATNIVGTEASSPVGLNCVDKPGISLRWGSALAGTFGLLFICLVACVCFSRNLKAKHPARQRAQSREGEDLSVQMPASHTEYIHYGELDFSRRSRPSDSAPPEARQQDTVYAQVSFTQPEDPGTATLVRK